MRLYLAAMDLDLADYCGRIGVEVPRAADLEALTTLQAAHAASVPFENLDIQRGLPIRLELAALVDKLVTRRRGGYCFEQNALLAAALERVGFRVTRLCGRVRMGLAADAPATPRTHMILEVEVAGAAYLVDVGFGGHQPLAPIPMVDGAAVVQHAWRFAVVQAGAAWTLRTRVPDRWIDLYTFTREPQHAIDFEVANHYTSTHPGSSFVRGLRVQRVTPEVRYMLTGRWYEEQRVDAVVTRPVTDSDDLAGLLRGRFGLELTADVRLPTFTD